MICTCDGKQTIKSIGFYGDLLRAIKNTMQIVALESPEYRPICSRCGNVVVRGVLT